MSVAPTRGLTLVLGGARSGKSPEAERVRDGLAPIYLATAQARTRDGAPDRGAPPRRRPAWPTVEEPLALPPCCPERGPTARSWSIA